MNSPRSILVLIFLTSCCISIAQAKTERKLTKLLNSYEDCKYIAGMLEFYDKPHPVYKVIEVGEPGTFEKSEVYKYVIKRQKETYPILVKMMSDKKYEWTCNLLLYCITERPADSLFKYWPGKCEQWKSEMMEKDLQYWKSHDYAKTQ
jgi:hypothetical protein